MQALFGEKSGHNGFQNEARNGQEATNNETRKRIKKRWKNMDDRDEIKRKIVKCCERLSKEAKELYVGYQDLPWASKVKTWRTEVLQQKADIKATLCSPYAAIHVISAVIWLGGEHFYAEELRLEVNYDQKCKLA